jgi:hypothetical protein
MPLDTYTFDITRRIWVRSYDEPSQVDAPVFGYKDNHDFGITFIRRLTGQEVEKVPGIVSVQFGLAVGTTKVTSATSSTADNYVFALVIPVIDSSGSTLATLMSGVTVKQQLLAEFKLTSSLGTNRYYTNVFVAPQINVDAIPDPAVTEPAVTMSEVAGVMTPKQWPAGMSMIIPDRLTGELMEWYIENREWKYNILG